MASSIAPIVFIIFPKLVKSFGVLGALRRLKSRLLRPRKIPVKTLFLDVFVCLEEG